MSEPPSPQNDRQGQILELAQRQGFVSIDGLARHFAVTPQTIRRDINQLCAQGLLQRYHGGAGPASPGSVQNADYALRKAQATEAKQRIARLVADHVPDQSSLFINIGTTTEAVAQALAEKRGLRIITNNLNVAGFLAGHTDFEVIIAGGLVRNRDGGIIGEATIDFIRQFRVDIGIIGISGIDLDGALLDFDYREVRVAQAIVANARRTFLAADHSKFGRSAMVRLGHIGEVAALFTDRAPPEPLAEVLAAHDVALHVAAE
ncbi:MAG TPA: DeoR family transcriptional regulator [Alphaproteobacteria bacterium]|nr:DeoR family transcriptional regulator [Alphaproteobacteria bacterium]